MPQTLSSRSDFLWADIQPDASRQMVIAAVDAFATSGYNATTTREIAERIGLSPAAIYVHYKSKELLLFEICRVGSQAAFDEVKAALDGADDPVDGLRRFVTAFTAWHAHNNTVARVIQYELGALSPEHFQEVDSIRSRCERLLKAQLRRGLASGDFRVADERSTTTALLSMSIDVARWYRGRRPSPDALGDRYAELALRMVGSHAAT